MATKIDVPNLVTYLNCTPIIERYMVGCGSKNTYQKDMCLKEIQLSAKTMITILGLTFNMVGGHV